MATASKLFFSLFFMGLLSNVSCSSNPSTKEDPSPIAANPQADNSEEKFEDVYLFYTSSGKDSRKPKIEHMTE